MRPPRSGVVRACVVLAATRLALRALRWRRAVELLDGPLAARRAPARGPAEVAAAVLAASRLLPGTSSCLAQALAARILLRREGLPGEIRIGVNRPSHGGIEAHAWIESEGQVILGLAEPKYAPFPRPVFR
jgi:hypothetical protein